MNDRQNFQDTPNSEDFNFEVTDRLRGLTVLLVAMQDFTEHSNNSYESQAFGILEDSLQFIIEKAKENQELIANLDIQIKQLSNQIDLSNMNKDK